MRALEGSPMWGIFKIGNTNGIAFAVFTSRKLCWRYIDLMKQEHLFNTASMEQAESKWGRDNYYVDRVATLTQQDTVTRFHDQFTSWPG